MSRVVVSDVCAAITNSGDLYTWGSNLFGQVGNGTGQVRQSGKLQAYRSFAATHLHVYERCRHFRRG